MSTFQWHHQNVKLRNKETETHLSSAHAPYLPQLVKHHLRGLLLAHLERLQSRSQSQSSLTEDKDLDLDLDQEQDIDV